MVNLYAQRATLFFISLILFAAAASAQNLIKLDVDATEAGRNIVHVKETVTVKPGPFTVFYPKWIPGDHRPSGPINDMMNLYFTANGTKHLVLSKSMKSIGEFNEMAAMLTERAKASQTA